jgi:hypothetical protein
MAARFATAGEIIAQARLAINDPNGTRWPDAVLYGYLLQAELQMTAKHPEIQYAFKVENPLPTLLANPTDLTTVQADHSAVLWHYVSYCALSSDTDDVQNLQAAQLHLKWMEDAV